MLKFWLCLGSFLFILTPLAPAQNENALMSKSRQLTFDGLRAGEGYFSSNGSRIIFQSERRDDNPFYQIYVMDLETGDTDPVSPGHGKTTCAWLHPAENKALFASTHLDPQARDKQKQELEFRASGQQRRYAWDYDEHYDLFEKDMTSGEYKRLTNELGYDAEGSWSPNGEWIAFASNRDAFANPDSMTAEDKEKFELDPAYMMDIYIMKADGSELKQLTKTRGYDGGPFFSADGSRICWRRFAPDGATAEIYTMNIDGSDQRRLTKIQAMSWAPYFHPSGEYLIFTTNKHGFANFELYLIDKDGAKEPVRVTETEGFDGLPVFTPDGNTLSWTSNRNGGKSQIFLAKWNHAKAMELLGLNQSDSVVSADLSKTDASISVDDLKKHVYKLASDDMQGRMTGTEGERMATDYVASVFQGLGLTGAGDDGSWFQEFPFVAGVSLGDNNKLEVNGASFEVDKDWRPLAFSKVGEVAEAGVVFAGYAISAPKADGFEEYDSFVHLDVKDKWIIAFRFMPADFTSEQRQHYNRFSSLRYKAMVARNKGARGLLIVSGPESGVTNELVKMRFDTRLAGSGIPALSISDKLAAKLLEGSGKDLATLQKQLDSGEPAMGFQVEGKTLAVNVDIKQEKRMGRNAIARMMAGDKPAASALIIGAHVDHLGMGSGNSLATDDERNQVHNGADDNASGIAAMLEIAQHLMDLKKSGKLKMNHDVLFGAWSGEELGLLGSDYFAKNYTHKKADESLSPEVIAYLNMDMVGRLEENLVVQGLGSSPYWAGEVEKRNAPVGLSIVTQEDSYLPTDATSFYLRGVPILAAFTGSHEDYHRPTDDAHLLNYEGMRDIARFMGLVARGLLRLEEGPEYVEMTKPENQPRAAMRAYLGTVPDYAQGDVKGVRLSGVAKGGPAEKAGVRGGDVIVELAGKSVENIYDYTYAIEALKVGQETGIKVSREGKVLAFRVTPGSRD